MKHYRDIYTPEFLSKFGDYREKVSDIPVGMKEEIDLQAIANACDITLKFDVIEHSGWSINDEDGNEREIIVNKLEPEYRQRFTIAHEIGHIILGHKGRSYRTDDLEQYKDTISRMNEVSANIFAAELVMPKSLVMKTFIDEIKRIGYSVEQSFDEYDISLLIEKVAMLLNVSKQALRYRVENLKVFIDG